VRFVEAAADATDAGDAVGVDGAAFARTRALNEAVRLRPTDAAAWLALANFENDAALGGGGGGVRQGALAEKRLAVLRRAVEANPRHDELRLALLRAAEALLPPEPLAREWEAAVAALPGSVPIWVAAIGARARAFAAFTVGDVRELGARALASLGTALEQAAAAGAAVAELEGRERGMLLVALRLAHAERAAGYDERALAALVALAELNCFCPPALLHAPAADRIAAFEEFWEAEAPRIGHADAKGWAAWADGGGAAAPATARVTAAEEAEDAEEADEGGTDAARRACWAWARREERLSRAGALPVASADEEAVEADPERVVIVDDVRRCLVVLRSPSVQTELLVELAAFAGLSAATPHVASAHPLAALRDATALAPEALLPPARAADDAVAAAVGAPWPAAGGGSAALDAFAREVARLGCVRFPADARLAALALAAAGRADAANGVRRAGRALLKAQPASLPLWRAYADAEAAAGNAAAAARVCATALALAPSGARTPSADLLELAFAAARLEMAAAGGAGDAKALSLLMHLWVAEAPAADESMAPPPTLVLRARRGYEAALRDGGGVVGGGRGALLRAFCCFEYLSAGVDAAVAVLEPALAALDETDDETAAAADDAAAAERGTSEHEKLLEAAVWLVRRPREGCAAFTPARLRALLERGVRSFPANRMLLSAFLDARATTHDRFRCRRFLAAACRRHPSCAPLWLCAVRFELGGGGASGGGGGASAALAPPSGARAAGARRARALLESALRPEAVGGCAALWRCYVQLELALGRAEVACRVLLRAVQQCPGCKALWCDALRPPLLPPMPPRQLRDVVQLMPEKEIRLRTDLPPPPPADAPPPPAAAPKPAAAAVAAAAAPPARAPPPGRRKELAPPAAQVEPESESDSSSSSSSAGEGE